MRLLRKTSVVANVCFAPVLQMSAKAGCQALCLPVCPQLALELQVMQLDACLFFVIMKAPIGGWQFQDDLDAHFLVAVGQQ